MRLAWSLSKLGEDEALQADPHRRLEAVRPAR